MNTVDLDKMDFEMQVKIVANGDAVPDMKPIQMLFNQRKKIAELICAIKNMPEAEAQYKELESQYHYVNKHIRQYLNL